MLGSARGQVRPFARALAAPFLWLRIPPNAVTLLTLLPAGASAWLLTQGRWTEALVWGVVASALDMVDGSVARALDRVTPFGGFLDSVVDRVVDVLFLFGYGFALGTTPAWALVAAGVVGGVGTPYARARAYEALHDIPEGSWEQLFERPERLLVLGLGVLGQALASSQGLSLNREMLLYALVLYAAGSVFTLVQRVIKVRWLLRAPASATHRSPRKSTARGP